MCRALRQLSSQAGLCLRKRGTVDLRKHGARCSSSARSMWWGGAPNNLTTGAVAQAQWSPWIETTIFRKYAPLHQGQRARGSVEDEVRCP